MEQGKSFAIYCVIGCLSLLIYTNSYTQEQEENNIQKMTEIMEEHTQKTRAKWNYNPFRKSETERKLIGWMDPDNFITSLWVGEVLSKNENLTDSHWNLDKVSMFYSIKIGTEINPISFTINDFTFRMGVAFFADIQLMGYSNFEHVYGGDILVSDYIRINMHFDFLVGDKLKFRWTALYHECAHVSGDYHADPSFDEDGKSRIGDLGIEGMGFELYYNWGFFTFYGGINFTYKSLPIDAYTTLFGFKFGMDMRIPVWGRINFITGIHLGANYDSVRSIIKYNSDGALNTVVNESKRWYPVIGIGMGFEFDRFIIGMKYSRMRSRHLLSHETIDERIGVDISIFY